MCHLCTPETAQVDWAAEVAERQIIEQHIRHADAKWDMLHVSNDFCLSLPESSSDDELNAAWDRQMASELKTARTLGLPCHESCGAFDDYTSQLLVSEKWIATHAPNIWWLSVGELKVSEDGKHATRELSARKKIVSQEDREKELDGLDGLDEGLDDEFVYEDVKYDFPPDASVNGKDIFAHQRRIERMRQREMTAIRELDGQAAVDHRERKTQMERVRSEKRERCI